MTINSFATGFDLSAIQGDAFSWQAIVDAGHSFIIARNGVGSNQLDSLYKKNVIGARSVNLLLGCYNVTYPLSNDDPAKEAAYHYGASEGVPSFIDLEYPLPQDWKTRGISAASITQWTSEYLQAYTALSGVKPIIYSYPYFFQALNLPQSFADEYKLWIASYTINPSIPKPWNDWTCWQSSGGSQTLPGTRTAVDFDYCKDLSIFGVVGALPVAATPPPIPEINTPETIVAPVITIPAPTQGNSVVVSAVANTSAPIVVPDPPTPEPTLPSGTATNIITDVENALKNQPGILSAVQNVVVKVITKLFHMK